MKRSRHGTKRLLAAMFPLVVVACHGWRPASMAPAGSDVRISFPTPQAIQGSFAGGAPMALDDVTAVQGKVTHASGDTVELQLTNARRQGRDIPSAQYKGATATIVLMPRSLIETKGFSGQKTALLAGGTGVVLLAVAAVLVALATVSLLAWQ